ENAARRPRGFGGGASEGAGTVQKTLASVSQAAMTAAMAMQGADVAPTAGQVAAAAKARADVKTLMPQWTAVKASAAAQWKSPNRATNGPSATMTSTRISALPSSSFWTR